MPSVDFWLKIEFFNSTSMLFFFYHIWLALLHSIGFLKSLVDAFILWFQLYIGKF